MRKTRILLVALALAAAFTALVFLVPAVKHSLPVRITYVPALLIAFLLSGDGHSITATTGWSTSVSIIVFYWITVLVLYALGRQFLHVRRAARHLEQVRIAGEAHPMMLAGPSLQEDLARLGLAIKEAETGRRKTMMLRPDRDLNLDDAPALLGARAITCQRPSPATKGILRRYRAQLRKEHGAEQAARHLENLQTEARRMAGGSASPHQGPSGPGPELPGLA